MIYGRYRVFGCLLQPPVSTFEPSTLRQQIEQLTVAGLQLYRYGEVKFEAGVLVLARGARVDVAQLDRAVSEVPQEEVLRVCADREQEVAHLTSNLFLAATPSRGGRLGRLRDDGNFIIDLQQRVRWPSWLLIHYPLCNHAVRRVYVVFKLLIHAEGGCAHGTLVRQMRRLQRHIMVLGHMVQQFPLIHLYQLNKLITANLDERFLNRTYSAANWAAPTVFALVGCFLHTRRD